MRACPQPRCLRFTNEHRRHGPRFVGFPAVHEAGRGSPSYARSIGRHLQCARQLFASKNSQYGPMELHPPPDASLQNLLEQGAIARLVQLLHADDKELKLNALWAFKNLLYKATPELKREVMSAIGWTEINM